MAQAASGDIVRVHYTGTLDDGTVFDSSVSRDPLEFTLGQGMVIPGFDAAVTGLTPGETCKVTIPAQEAYGPHHDEMVLVVDRAQVPEDLNPQVGQQLQLMQPDGTPVPVMVVEATDAHVKLDANHPLAGQDLTFEIELVEIA